MSHELGRGQRTLEWAQLCSTRGGTRKTHGQAWWTQARGVKGLSGLSQHTFGQRQPLPWELSCFWLICSLHTEYCIESFEWKLAELENKKGQLSRLYNCTTLANNLLPKPLFCIAPCDIFWQIMTIMRAMCTLMIIVLLHTEFFNGFYSFKYSYFYYIKFFNENHIFYITQNLY